MVLFCFVLVPSFELFCVLGKKQVTSKCLEPFVASPDGRSMASAGNLRLRLSGNYSHKAPHQEMHLPRSSHTTTATRPLAIVQRHGKTLTRDGIYGWRPWSHGGVRETATVGEPGHSHFLCCALGCTSLFFLIPFRLVNCLYPFAFWIYRTAIFMRTTPPLGGVSVCVHPGMQREPQVQVQEMQGAGALSGGLLPTKTPPGRGENVPARSWHGH